METLLSRCERDRRLRFMLSPTDCTQTRARVRSCRRVERGQRGQQSQRGARAIERFVRCASDRRKLFESTPLRQAAGFFSLLLEINANPPKYRS